MPSSKSFNLLGSVSAIQTDASQNITSGSYDQTKTNAVNRIQQAIRTGAVLQTLGASPVVFLDTQDVTSGFVPGGHGYSTDPIPGTNTCRVFIPLTIATNSALVTIAYFEYDTYADTYTYIGQLRFTLNTATTHTLRGIAVDDNGGTTSGWSVHFLTTNATAANGGYFYCPNVSKSQFAQVSFPTIPSATTGNTQATNAVFFMQETGGTNLLTTGVGIALDATSKIAYLGNSTTNTVFYKFNYTTAITTVGGTGITSDCFSFKTGANAIFSVALLQTNTMKLAIPKSSQNASLIGQKCIYVSSASAGYHFLASDLSNGSTTIPSLVTWNKLGTGTDYSAVTYSIATWSNLLDCEFNYSTTGVFMMKRSINSDPNMMIFGKNDPIYAEVAGTKYPTSFAGITVGGMFMTNGVLMATSTVVGQRGVYCLNVAADKYFYQTYAGAAPPSYIVTKVLDAKIATAIALSFKRELSSAANIPVSIQYRTSNFNVFPGTWTTFTNKNNDLSVEGGLQNITGGVQLRIPNTLIGDYAVNPMQLNDVLLLYTDLFMSDDNLEFVFSQSSTATPGAVSWKLKSTYSSNPSLYTMNLYADDGTNTVLTGMNSSTNMTSFFYSLDGGTSYTQFSTANPVAANAANAIIKVVVSSPPGVNTRATMRAS